MQKILLPEWAPQQFVQLTWPHEGTDWADMIDEVNRCFVEIARCISQYEKLLIVCHDRNQVKKQLEELDSTEIFFVELPSNDTWARDHGGITVFENGKRTIYDFAFNGWGRKFEAELDNQLTGALYRKGVFGPATVYRDCLDFVLEGGSIESDGEGTLLTTTSCLLSDNRNDLSKEEIESELKSYFGLERVLWLHHGYLKGDDTDGHIDTLARFCSPDTIAYVRCDDESDEHYETLKKMEAELSGFTRLDGKPYNLVPLPMADAVYEKGERLPATYANFLIVNGAVLLPCYGSPKDEIALQQLKQVFPKREITGINCLPLIKQHGSLHCVTMQY